MMIGAGEIISKLCFFYLKKCYFDKKTHFCQFLTLYCFPLMMLRTYGEMKHFFLGVIHNFTRRKLGSIA